MTKQAFRRALQLLLSVLCLPALAPAQPSPELSTRVDDSTGKLARAGQTELAYAYMRLERAFFTGPVEDAMCARVNRDLDAAAVAVFAGRPADAVRIINDSISLLEGPDASPIRKLARSLRFRVKPRVLVGAGPSVIDVHVEAIAPLPMEVTKLNIELRLDTRSTRRSGMFLSRPLRFDNAEGRVATSTVVTFDADPAFILKGEHASFDMSLGAVGQGFEKVGACYAAKAPFSSVRERSIEAISNAPKATADQRRALAVFAARNELLTDEPGVSTPTEFVTDFSELADQLTSERAELLNGVNPYRRRFGDIWKVVPPADGSAEAPIPLRLYAPLAAEKESPLPLVVALHGAGADESMFFDGYGCGRLRDLAHWAEFIVVAPRIGPFSASPELFDRIVEDVTADYVVDRSRIYVIGHSMGGGVASAWASARPTKIAAACTIAGVGGFAKGATIPPVLVISAELDGVVPAVRIRERAEKAAAAGLPVEFREMKHYGHILVVGAALPDAVEWLLEHRLQQ